jgi:hypothetical protein
MVDNGNNTPNPSVVRLGTGGAPNDGLLLLADSSQPTGLHWLPLSTAETDKGIPRFNGVNGLPPLESSNVTITDNGAIQTTGGNVRGTDSVDLQANRSSAAQVASGNQSTIGGGTNNTASGQFSTVAGGGTNQATQAQATVGGGFTNNATGAESTVAGGNTNTASGSAATVGGGQGNTANGPSATIAGGLSNTVSGARSVVGGGQSNNASGGNATIAGGANNTCSATSDGTVGGGAFNTVSASFATVFGGYGANAYLMGQVAWAGGVFASYGDAQVSILQARCLTKDGTTATPMTLDGGASDSFGIFNMVIPTDTAWAFDGQIVCRSNESPPKGAMWTFTGIIQNNAGTVSMIGSNVANGVENFSPNLANPVVTADNTNKALKITVVGQGSTNIRWLARTILTEVFGAAGFS